MVRLAATLAGVAALSAHGPTDIDLKVRVPVANE